jgi:hypothetical protein
MRPVVRAIAWPVVALLAAAAAVGVAAPAVASADARQPVFRWQDPQITESSGLVVVDGRFVTANDSGNSATLYVVDPATGQDVTTVTWARHQVDVEALAPGPDGSVWVGDIGDNQANRRWIVATRVPADGSPATSYVLRYPGGAAHDAETLLAHPVTGRLYVVTKSLTGGDVLAAPKRLATGRPNLLRPVGSVAGWLTDGAFWPDGRHVVLRDYGRASVYTFPGLELLGSFGLPRQPQGEAIAVSPDERVFVSSEGVGTPVWEVTVPKQLRAAMASSTGTASSSPAALPAAGSGSPSAEASPGASTPSSGGTQNGGSAADDGSGGPSPWAVVVAVLVGLGLLASAWWWAKVQARS